MVLLSPIFRSGGKAANPKLQSGNLKLMGLNSRLYLRQALGNRSLAQAIHRSLSLLLSLSLWSWLWWLLLLLLLLRLLLLVFNRKHSKAAQRPDR